MLRGYGIPTERRTFRSASLNRFVPSSAGRENREVDGLDRLPAKLNLEPVQPFFVQRKITQGRDDVFARDLDRHVGRTHSRAVLAVREYDTDCDCQLVHG